MICRACGQPRTMDMAIRHSKMGLKLNCDNPECVLSIHFPDEPVTGNNKSRR